MKITQVETVWFEAMADDIGHAVQAVAERAGFGVVREYVGHGIGREMHEEPNVPNFGQAGTGPTLKRGMVLAIEPMINDGAIGVMVDADGWTARTRRSRVCSRKPPAGRSPPPS